MTSPVSAIEAIERFERAVRANGYRTSDDQTEAEYQAAKAAVLTLARQAEALQRENAELRTVTESGQAFANQVRGITYKLNGQAYSSTVSELNQFDADLRRARALLGGENAGN